MEDYAPPVVKSKPLRAREMITKMVTSAKKNKESEDLSSGLVSKPSKRYHEGYVEDKLYLVPDSNLEAMKDIINLKMRPKTSTRYKHETSIEISDYDQVKNKLKVLLDKILKMPKYSFQSESIRISDEFKLATQQETIMPIMEPGIDQAKTIEKGSIDKSITSKESMFKVTFSVESIEENNEQKKVEEEMDKDNFEGKTKEAKDEKSIDIHEAIGKAGKKIETKHSKVVETYEEELDKTDIEELNQEVGAKSEDEFNIVQIKELASNNVIKPDTALSQPEADQCRLRFLVSGHFSDGQTPLYIIKPYSGEPNIFKNKNINFSSKLNGDGHDIFMSGIFYKENIIEMSEGNPVAMNIESNKILLNEENCQVYEKSFNSLFEYDNIDVLFKGEFIQSNVINDITPLLTVQIIKKKILNNIAGKLNLNLKGGDMNNQKNSTTVLLYSKHNEETPFTVTKPEASEVVHVGENNRFSDVNLTVYPNLNVTESSHITKTVKPSAQSQ